MSGVKFNLSSLSFLVVDDSQMMCSLVRGSILAFGAKSVRVAQTSMEAAKHFENPEIDLIMIDHQFEVDDPMNGVDLVRLIRSLPDPHRRRAILFFTAFSDKTTALAAKEAGVNDILVKPFSMKSLYTKVTSVLAHPKPFVVSPEYTGPLWET